MLDSAASCGSTAHAQQMSRQIETGNFAEEYFASLSGPAKRLIEDVVAVREAYEDVWTGLNENEQEQIINENIIRPEAILTYEVKPQSSKQVRLSSFGVHEVFPRLKVETGQKENSFEDTIGSQDLSSECAYSYRDEHSAPWSWLTRSQQDLTFESGTCTESLTSEELAEQGLETINASPSRVLQRQSLLIRQSKGNPLYAKPVGIPIVPVLPKQEIARMDTKPPVSPHKINNFVYEEDNRIILDFGEIKHETTGRDLDVCSESSRSSSGLLAKMKETKATLKKSLSNVSNGGTLKRKKAKSTQASPCSTLSRSSTLKSNTIVKPSAAPPPPPPRTSTSAKNVMSQSLYLPKQPSDEDIVKPLEEFKIDLNTQSDIPKTGFDFLDNW